MYPNFGSFYASGFFTDPQFLPFLSFGLLNPIQAGVFWNIGSLCPTPLPLFLLYLLSNYCQTWHDSTMAQNLSKGSKSQIHNDVTRCHLCSVEYQKLLKTVYIQIGTASSSFTHSYSNLAETFNTSIALDQKVGFKIIEFPLF